MACGVGEACQFIGMFLSGLPVLGSNPPQPLIKEYIHDVVIILALCEVVELVDNEW